MKTFGILSLVSSLLASTVLADTLLNVSYDPTREFYQEFNAAFANQWKQQTGRSLVVKQSHGGSGKQARSVIDGLSADVVTLALSGDIDVIAKQANLLPGDWRGSPNPKTSGGARWNYLAAWAYAERKFGGDGAKVKEYIRTLYRNVPVLDTGARGSTTTFAQRGIGDVFLSWENEAHLIAKEFPGKTQIVIPSISILAEPPVAVVEKNARKHGTEELAKAYLGYLYSAEAQNIAGKHFYRPRDAKALTKWSKNFPRINLVKIDNEFGGWTKAQKTHFDDGGTFDQIYKN